MHAYIHAGRQAERLKDSQRNSDKVRHTNEDQELRMRQSHTDARTDGKTDRQAGRHAGRQAD
jgi:hypothetical protein